MNGLDWQTVQIPMVGGLQQRTNEQALDPPALARAVDVQFDEIGGLQPRPTFFGLGTTTVAAGGSIYGGGTLSTARRIVRNGDELLLFSKDTLYSWNAQQAVWVSRGTHLAAKIDEAPRFVTTDDQVDADRAECKSTVFLSWTAGTTTHVAGYDKVTGSVVLSPYAIATAVRARMIALTNRIVLMYTDGSGTVSAKAFDPLDPTTGLAAAATTVRSGIGASAFFDVAKHPTSDLAVFAIRQTAGLTYDVGTVSSTAVVSITNKARQCDGPIAVALAPDGASIQVVRANGLLIEGDLLNSSTFADVHTAQAIGVAAGLVNQIAAAYQSVLTSGQYRCYVFYSSKESTGGTGAATQFETRTNWVAPNNTLGTDSAFVKRVGVASRAFGHDGRVYLWTVFGSVSAFTGSSAAGWRAALQNTYFLYRDDGFLVAKAATSRAGGFCPSQGRLPGVQSTTSGVYAWAGTERRVIDVGEKQSDYGARAPREIAVTFDSNEARRCARLGNTLYIASGEALAYDGVRLAEVGFHVYPTWFVATSVATGNLTDGTYTYKLTWRWENAQGELDRSTTATSVQSTVTAGPKGVQFATIHPLAVTHKTDVAPAVEVWRTAVNPVDDAPFYLVTSKDPAATSNPNRYLPNAPTSYTLATLNDEFADATATTKESNPENYGVLENLAPPPATIIAANADRLFLAGVAGDPHRVWYSKLREDGQVAAFNDALTVAVPPGNGVITALAFLNDTLIVFKETAIYALSGDGFNNLGQGLNYGPARVLSVDVGAIDHDSVALCDKGLIFKSRKGWYILNRGWTVDYIGAGVADYDGEAVYAVSVIEAQHQIRCITSGRVLVFDTLVNQWAEWSLVGVHATTWGGDYCYLTATGAQYEYDDSAGFLGSSDLGGYDVETGWIKPADLQGYLRVRAINILGIRGGGALSHRLRIRIARDYVNTYIDDRYWTITATSSGDPVQVRIQPPIQQVQAIKVRITVAPPMSGGVPVAHQGAQMTLTGLGLEVGIKRGLYRRMPAAQRQ